jgi:TetR/AcrR family transcriptional regulator, transcriptional repressor for nem operon
MLAFMASATHSTRRSDDTRAKILNAAFIEFYRNGFQGGSLGRIVEAAEVTKGALFHHFASKQELGYAVVDEVIGSLLEQRWLHPLTKSDDPIAEIQSAFRRFIDEDIESGAWLNGCPLNNLAQEMSPLDEGFRTRIERMYATWRSVFSVALRRGIERGVVRADVDPHEAATFIVVAQMGIWGTGKYSHDDALMRQSGEALCWYLDTLRCTDSANVEQNDEQSAYLETTTNSQPTHNLPHGTDT